MKKIVTLFLALLLFSAMPAWADKAELKNGFMGIAWGSSAQDMPRQIQAKPLLASGDFTSFNSRSVTLGGLKLDEVQFFYFKDQFIQAIILHKDMEQLAQALSNQFGPPDMEHDDGVISWQVEINPDEVVSMGIIPERQAAAVVNSKLMMQVMEGGLRN